MFRGNALAKIDGKGRLKMPAAYRSALEDTDFYVTSLRGESVRIYPMPAWRKIEDRLDNASSFDPAVMRFRNFTSYFGQSASMDAQGRVLLHPLVRERAALDGEVAVLGQGDFLEVWNRAQFERRLLDEPLTDAHLKDLAELGI